MPMSATRKPKPAAEPVQDEVIEAPDPVQAGPTVTIEAGDLTAPDALDEIAARLRENPQWLHQVTEQASKVYKLARAVASAELIDPTWQHLQRCYGYWKNQAANNMYPGSPEGFRQRANMVQTALVAIAFLEKFPRMSGAEMQAMWRQKRDQPARDLYFHQQACAVEAGRSIPAQSTADIIKRLAAAGITLSVSADGLLKASPAGSLTDAEKAALQRNKAAIVEYLNSTETVA